MTQIGIIDYGMGNLGSVTNACRFLALPAEVITAPAQMDECRALILPGVGAFGDCMAHLRDHGFMEPIRAWIAKDRPFLGICVGLQALYEGSEESPGAEGLGIFPGLIKRFQIPAEYKVPHIGWSRLRQQVPGCPLFNGIPDESYFYFVHSYYADAATREYAAGVTSYGVDYASVIWKGRLMAVQFHPEKSQKLGLRMLTNFSDSVGNDDYEDSDIARD